MLFLEPPCLAAIARLLSTPDEGVGLDIVERPAQHRAFVVNTPENDPIRLSSTLHSNESSMCRTYKHHSPHFGLVIEESHRRADTSLFRGCLWIGNPDVLHGAAVDDPAEL
jgi:hypothetical protein